MRVALLSAVLLVLAVSAFYLAHNAKSAHASSSPAAAPSSKMVPLPLYFEPNQGQTNPQVKFLAHGAGYGLFLTSSEAVLDLERPASKERPAAGSVIRMHLEGASAAPSIQATGQLPGKSSYFIGNDPAKWHRDIPQFARVEYANVYPGINLIYYGKQRQLEYDFRVAPGAEPNQITLCFEGAAARLDSGDLVLTTANGDVRFQAPHMYQVSGGHETAVNGGFRLAADNKVAFTIGRYDRSRELVIDPVLSYSTYLGGSGTESLVSLAVGQDFNMYVAGSTNSTDFPGVSGGLQNVLNGPTNLFIAKMNTSGQLLYSTYLGGNGIDDLAGVAVDNFFNIYVAGTTTSTNFPTSTTAFQTSATFGGTSTTCPANMAGAQCHGFVSALLLSGTTYTMGYSTYLAGNGNDTITGLAVDPKTQSAFVTGHTTSTNTGTGFPSTPTAYQVCPFQPPPIGATCPTPTGILPPQFFATEVFTINFAGTQSVGYSTYLGGSNGTITTGGGIAVDGSDNMYITGTTDMQNFKGVNGATAFPANNAYQPCLNQPGVTTCVAVAPGITDGILSKINPNLPSSPPYFVTYVGGSGTDAGVAVGLDSSGNAYVTGSTNSTDIGSACTGACIFGPQQSYVGTSPNSNAFLAKVDNETITNTIFPISFFSYIGGSGPDVGNAIVVDPSQNAYVTGSTQSANLLTQNVITEYVNKNFVPINGGAYNGGGDAFVALLSTTIPSTTTTPFPPTAPDYISYLGGSGADVGSGIGLDTNSNAYVAGTTASSNFPVTGNAYQPALNGPQDAFVAAVGARSSVASQITVTAGSGSPSPSPVPAGTSVAFTFVLTNTGPDPATNVIFTGSLPSTPLATTAKAIASAGSCGTVVSSLVTCNFPFGIAPQGTASVEIDLTPSVPLNYNPSIYVSGAASANGGPAGPAVTQGPATVVDYTIACSPAQTTVTPGGEAIFTVTLMPSTTFPSTTITMGQTISPAIVTASTPTYTIPSVVLSGSATQTTYLEIQTVPQPVTTGSLFRRATFFATWLPIGGLSLLGLGIGLRGRNNNRYWFVGALLGMIVLLLLLPACSSNSSSVTPNQGTASGQYVVTVSGGAGTAAAHNAVCYLNVT